MSVVTNIVVPNRGNNALSAIYVNDKLLVDQGVAGAPTTGNTVLTLSGDTDLAYFREGDVVQSEGYLGDWLAQFTAISGALTTPENAFNGIFVEDAAGTANYNAASVNSYGAIMIVNFTSGSKLPSGTVEILGYPKNFQYLGGQTLTVNGTKDYSMHSSTIGWLPITEDGASVKTLKLVGNGSTFPLLQAIRINGKVLVDSSLVTDAVKIVSIDDSVPSITVDDGEWDPAGVTGDAKVTCQSPLKAPTNWTVEAIEGNTLSLSHATPDDNAQVWVANDNQAGTDFYVTGPSIVDEPLLTADVRLESSLFATTPADADTLKNIVWELNGAQQNAGTSNPYTPTGLATNTTYTVRVKHQGNALEDSPWSDSTTFTTGATRNLYTYYKERVEVLENRLAGLEADEVVDDATDVTLLTAFANLVARVEALEGGA